jgi:hypothetical protein
MMMTTPLLSACRRCGSSRISYRIEVFGERRKPVRERVQVCTCEDCQHCWTEALTAPVREREDSEC